MNVLLVVMKAESTRTKPGQNLEDRNVQNGFHWKLVQKEDLPRIFEKGYTGVNGRENNRATGIGLYLSKKIMKRLGHRIYVTSEEGKGTKVFLEFSQNVLTMY